MSNETDRQREHFNKISEVYSEARRNSNHLLLKSLIWRNFFKDKKNAVPAGAKVLEPMCGMAEGFQIIREYAQPNIQYLGFDYSENMVEIARQKFPGQRIEWHDATKFDSNGEQFDFIVLIGGLHHVFANSADVVKRLCATLKPGGAFLNFEPTQNSVVTRKIRQRIYDKNAIFDEQTEQGFDLPDLNRMFEDAGMSRVDQVYPGMLSYVLYYNPDAFPFLNLGGAFSVKATFFLDRLLWRTWLAKKLSFATITLWRKESQ